MARAGLVLFVLAVPPAGCAAGASTVEAAPTTATPAVPADATTRRLAEVELARQCGIDSTNFAEEAQLTSDLDDRLTAAGFTHAEWKRWHDALVKSPELVAQYTAVSSAGCPPR